VTTPPEGADEGTLLQLDDGDSVREARIWVVKA
jgi:hypothetical protein